MLNKFYITLISSQKMKLRSTNIHWHQLVESSIHRKQKMTTYQFCASKSVDPSTIPDATTHINTLFSKMLLQT